MWGIVPAAGRGSRIQPLAFSKELLPLGKILHGDAPRPCAVAEYLLDRMLAGGADKLCIVIGAGKADIVDYFGGNFGAAQLAYVVQPSPSGLCDAIFRAAPLIGSDGTVAVGLPDTVWFPEDGLAALPDDALSFLLFPVAHPEHFDAVLLNGERVIEIRVKESEPGTHWIWGAFKMPARVFHALHALWQAREPRDEYIGTLVNAYLAQGGRAVGVKAGETYMDVGTLEGYRAAMHVLMRNRPARTIAATDEFPATGACP
ncbi:MAG TPA: sugar phosphate nucleotidyltransferase [Rhodanobacteraceae bacterium]